MKHIPNILSLLRLLGIPAMVFALCRQNHSGFLTLYLLLGLTDLLDGYLARRFGVTSKLGHLLDTVADFFYYGTALWCLYYLVPGQMHPGTWLIPALILLLIIGVIVGYIRHNRFLCAHTLLFKVVCSLLFVCVPLSYVFDMTLPITLVLILYLLASADLILLYLRSPSLEAVNRSRSGMHLWRRLKG